MGPPYSAQSCLRLPSLTVRLENVSALRVKACQPSPRGLRVRKCLSPGLEHPPSFGSTVSLVPGARTPPDRLQAEPPPLVADSWLASRMTLASGAGQNTMVCAQGVGVRCHWDPRLPVLVCRGERGRKPRPTRGLGEACRATPSAEMWDHPGLVIGTPLESELFPSTSRAPVRSSLATCKVGGSGSSRPLRGPTTAEAGGGATREGGKPGEGAPNEGAPLGAGRGLPSAAPAETPPSTSVNVNGPFRRFVAQCIVVVLALGFVDAG